MTKQLAYKREYALNAICPYYTMFPLEYPMRILKNHYDEQPVILDPFCGRGTTIYAARVNKLKSYGIDVSPIAVAVAQAKQSRSTWDQVFKLTKRFLAKKPKDIPNTSFFRMAYSKRTLVELCSLRESLLNIRKESDESVLLRALCLGCLHGPLARNKSDSAYFSNQMPRTFSSKPNYSVKYWRERNLKAPDVSVLDVIQRKALRISDIDSDVYGNYNSVKLGDARLAKNYPKTVNPLVVITSPPYYGMKTYIQDQWLRNWFLGGSAEVDYSSTEQISHSGIDSFINDLAKVWDQTKKCSDNIHLYVRLGTIPSSKADAREIFYTSIRKSSDWKLISTRKAKTAHAGKRQADQMLSQSNPQIEYDFHARLF